MTARRVLARAVIVAEVAETGIAGKAAIRAYVEARMSREAFTAACSVGLAIFDRRHVCTRPGTEQCAECGHTLTDERGPYCMACREVQS